MLPLPLIFNYSITKLPTYQILVSGRSFYPSPVLQAQCHVNQFLAHVADLGNGFSDGNALDLIAAQHHHAAEPGIVYQVNRSHSVPRGQHAVKWSRRAAPLDVS